MGDATTTQQKPGPAPSLDSSKLMWVYHTLYGLRGNLGWWPGETPFEIAVGAVLTQNTAWSNVERALRNLKAACPMTAEAILNLPRARLEQIVRPAGYFRVKARRLLALMELLRSLPEGLDTLGTMPTLEARERLLAVCGIGYETADSILLYALNKAIFVVDAYTKRLFRRLGLLTFEGDYEDLRLAIQQAIPNDVELYKDYHAQIVIHCKETCRKRPSCAECVLLEGCGRLGLEG